MSKSYQRKITKLVIPAAGFGTRFMPATKSIPKELVPVIDKPSLQYIVEEAISAGIKDIYIIISSDKQIIKKHFAEDKKLKQLLTWKKRQSLIKSIEVINKKAKIHYVYQNDQLGLGHAIWTTKDYIKNDCFAVILADDITLNYDDHDCAIGECIKLFEEQNADIVLGVQEVAEQDVSKYGILKVKKLSDNSYNVEKAVEKPKIENAPSRFAILGRYVFTPEIFDYLENTEKDERQEIEITNAIDTMIKSSAHKVLACKFKAHRYDIGHPEGFVLANITIALRKGLISKEAIVDLLKEIK